MANAGKIRGSQPRRPPNRRQAETPALIPKLMQLVAVFTIAGLTPESGGPSRSVPALALALADLAVRVQIVSLDFGRKESPPLIPSSEKVSTRLVFCRTSRRIPTLWSHRFAAALQQAVISPATTILHDNGAWLPTNHAAARIARRLHCPLVVSPRGMLARWSLSFKAVRKQLAWLLFQQRDLKSARVFQVTSGDEAADLRRLGFRQPIALIPNGVVVPGWVPRNPRPKPRRTLLFLSRIHPKKGLLFLAEAWAALKPEGWRVVVAGPDSENHLADLRARLLALGIERDFSFPGPVDEADKWQFYREADLFVLPSLQENFGIVVAEALGTGLPVIASRATPWSELESCRCGWWIQTGTNPLAEALRHAIHLSDAEREEMGNRGRRLVQDRFAWPAIAREVRALYQWTLGTGQRPGSVIDV